MIKKPEILSDEELNVALAEHIKHYGGWDNVTRLRIARKAQRDKDWKEMLGQIKGWLQNTSMDAHTTVFQVSTKDWEALQSQLEEA